MTEFEIIQQKTDALQKELDRCFSQVDELTSHNSQNTTETGVKAAYRDMSNMVKSLKDFMHDIQSWNDAVRMENRLIVEKALQNKDESTSIQAGVSQLFSLENELLNNAHSLILFRISNLEENIRSLDGQITKEKVVSDINNRLKKSLLSKGIFSTSIYQINVNEFALHIRKNDVPYPQIVSALETANRTLSKILKLRKSDPTTIKPMLFLFTIGSTKGIPLEILIEELRHSNKEASAESPINCKPN